MIKMHGLAVHEGYFTVVISDTQFVLQMHQINLQCSSETFHSWKYLKQLSQVTGASKAGLWDLQDTTALPHTEEGFITQVFLKQHKHQAVSYYTHIYTSRLLELVT